MTIQLPSMIILMGVSGSGKSTIGRQLAIELGWNFADADDFHSPENKAKMQRGEALDDCDRAPWLATLRSTIQTWHQTQQPTILGCSALKASYRRQLESADATVQWVYLQGTFQQIQARLMRRQQLEPEHFMGAELLQSQFDALEEPEDAIWIGVERSPTEVIQMIMHKLGLSQNNPQNPEAIVID